MISSDLKTSNMHRSDNFLDNILEDEQGRPIVGIISNFYFGIEHALTFDGFAIGSLSFQCTCFLRFLKEPKKKVR